MPIQYRNLHGLSRPSLPDHEDSDTSTWYLCRKESAPYTPCLISSERALEAKYVVVITSTGPLADHFPFGDATHAVEKLLNVLFDTEVGLFVESEHTLSVSRTAVTIDIGTPEPKRFTLIDPLDSETDEKKHIPCDLRECAHTLSVICKKIF